MPTEREDVESLAAHLAQADEEYQGREMLADVGNPEHEPGDWWPFIATAALSWFRALAETGEVSDGHHTHRELYEYRMLYHAHAAQGWLAMGVPVVKSRRHSDGEPCFGGGWFIVVATLPSGQVSNHYRDEHWDMFDVPEVDLPPEYDGHTPAIAAKRLRTIPRARRAVRSVLRGERRFIDLWRRDNPMPTDARDLGAWFEARRRELEAYRG